jgi:predicted ATPase
VISWSEHGKTRLRTLPPGELAHFRQLTDNYRSFRHARAALVKLHQQLLAHVDRLETALQLPPPKPAARRRKK